MKRLRGSRGEDGSIAIAILLLLAVFAIVAAMSSSAVAAGNRTLASKYLTVAQQMRYLASQDAASRIGSTLRTDASPPSEGDSGATPLDVGSSTATWSWEVEERVKADASGAEHSIDDCFGGVIDLPPSIGAVRVNATGVAGRDVPAPDASRGDGVDVSGSTASTECFVLYEALVEPDLSSGSYNGTINLSPEAAFGHVVFGTEGVTIDRTSSTESPTPATRYPSVTGSIGSSSDVTMNVRNQDFKRGGVYAYDALPTDAAFGEEESDDLAGSAAPRCVNETNATGAVNPDGSVNPNYSAGRCKNVHSFSQRVQLDVVRLDDIAATPRSSGGAGCADYARDTRASVGDSSNPVDGLLSTNPSDPRSPGLRASETSWYASRHLVNGTATLDLGVQQCYRNVVFDAPTVVRSSDSRGLFATGDVTFGSGVDVGSTSVPLTVYALGDLDSVVSFEPGTGRSSVSAFTYAPRALCSVGESGGRSITGSLACRFVQVRDGNTTLATGGKPTDVFAGVPASGRPYVSVWYPEQKSVAATK